MKISTSLLKSALAVGLLSSVATAGWPELKEEMHIDKLRNAAWPQPFRGIDAAAVVSPFEIQKANGWRLFDTIGATYFDETNALNDSGVRKIATSLSKNPSNHRVIYVLKGDTPEHTATRLESVQIAVSQLVPVDTLPEIFITDRDTDSVSGENQTLLNRGLSQTTPAPRLPKFNGLNTPSNQQQLNIKK